MDTDEKIARVAIILYVIAVVGVAFWFGWELLAIFPFDAPVLVSFTFGILFLFVWVLVVGALGSALGYATSILAFLIGHLAVFTHYLISKMVRRTAP